MTPTRSALAGLAAAAACYGANAATTITGITPLRVRLWPTLAGIGPDLRHIALTFDDGPDASSTPLILDELDRLDVHATFFLLGAMTDRHRQVAAELVARGHEIGLHGYHHKNLLTRPARWTARDIRHGFEAVSDAAGVAPRFYRPPYGVLTTAALCTARQLGLTPLLWSAWGVDWEEGGTGESVIGHLKKGLAGGGTVLLHDSDCTSAPRSWTATLAALPLLAAEAGRFGARLGPAGEHFAQPVAP